LLPRPASGRTAARIDNASAVLQRARHSTRSWTLNLLAGLLLAYLNIDEVA